MTDITVNLLDNKINVTLLNLNIRDKRVLSFYIMDKFWNNTLS